MKLNFRGIVNEQGQLHIYNRNDFDEQVKMFTGKKVVISLENQIKKRSLSQNAYYWYIAIPVAQKGLIDVGYKISTEETHEYLRNKFLLKELVNEETGEILKSIKSTTELSTSQFMDYIAEIQQFCSEYLNIYLPSPNEQVKAEL